jgi:hypothetical protein
MATDPGQAAAAIDVDLHVFRSLLDGENRRLRQESQVADREIL